MLIISTFFVFSFILLAGMPFTLKNLKQQLSLAKAPRLYFITGPEVFLIKQSLEMIKSRYLNKETYDFNYEVFQAGKTPAEKLKEMAERLPVNAEKRVLICEEVHQFKEKDWQYIEPLLKEEADHLIAVFVSTAPDKRKKIIKKLLLHCESVSAQKVKDSQWPEWIEWMAKREGLKLQPLAVQLLQEQAGYDLLSLENEIKKLKNLSKDKHEISGEDILKIVPRTRPENIFALSTAIGQKNLSSALICLARLLEDNQNAVGALALILRHIRILARVKEGMKKGFTAQTLSAKTGVPSFFIKNYTQTAKHWTNEKIMSTLEALKATDKALKSSSLSSHVWLENFIIKTCSL